MSRIYTKTGDKGETSLFSGKRVSKNCPRLDASGSLDELVCSLGLAVSLLSGTIPKLQRQIVRIQGELMSVLAQLANEGSSDWQGGDKDPEQMIEALEKEINEMSSEMPGLSHFILPGGVPTASQLQVCRVVCRRAERRVVSVASVESMSGEVVRYINRLSDWLFTAGRYVNYCAGIAETIWNPK